MKYLAALVGFWFLAIGFGGVAAADDVDSYKLGVEDRLRIRVVEWQPIDGTFREWTAVSGEYTVGISGAVSIPFVGEAQVSGKTTADVATMISDRLQRKFGLTDKPDASVELAAYRPVYIVGDVRTPGQYPFAPDLTVLKAVGLAGGSRDGTALRTERDYIQAKGNYNATYDQWVRLTVRSARLQAEEGGQSNFAIPKEVEASPGVKNIYDEEQAVMNSRQRKVSLQLEALSDLQTLLTSEIATLEKKLVTQKRQMELAQEELKGVGSLADKGLVSNTRLFTSERLLAEIEGRNLDLDTSILRAKQDISKSKQDEINIRNTLDSQIADERQETEARLKEAVIKMSTYRSLIAEAIQAGNSATDEEPRIVYSVVRKTDGVAKEIAADETSAVLPGDVVKIRTVLPDPVNQVGQ